MTRLKLFVDFFPHEYFYPSFYTIKDTLKPKSMKFGGFFNKDMSHYTFYSVHATENFYIE